MTSSAATKHRTTAWAIRIVALMLIAAGLLGAGSSRADVASGIRPIGAFDRIPADVRAVFGDQILPGGWDSRDPTAIANDAYRHGVSGTFLMLPTVRQLWQFYPYGPPNKTAVAVRSLDTQKLVHTFVVDGNVLRGAEAGSGGGEWMNAVDGDKRLFLVQRTFTGSAILEIDLKSFAVQTRPFEPNAIFPTLTSSGFGIGGLTYDAVQQQLIALFGAVRDVRYANTNTYVYSMNVSHGDRDGQTALRQVRACGGPLPSVDLTGRLAVQVLTSAEHVWVTCHRAGQVGAVVRIPRAGLVDPTSDETIALGPANVRNVLVDQGAGRITLATDAGEMWVFEAESMSFIGVVPARADRSIDTEIGYGLDGATGRLFFQSSSYGFGIVESRFFPVPQARVLPEQSIEGQEVISSDHKTGRVYVLPGFASGKSTKYTIYDIGAAPAPPGLPDPDRNTVDRNEKDGETESRYFASGNGYGMRVLIANGLHTVVPAPVVGPASPIALAIAGYVNSKCGFTDRELVAGRVAKAEYDTGSTAASAIAADIDERTKLDLEKPSRCDLRINGQDTFRGLFGTAPDGTDGLRQEIEQDDDDTPRWNRKPATCSSSEGGKPAEDKGDDGGQQSLGTSEVKCPLPGKSLSAHAVSRLHGEVAVGHAETKVDIERGKFGVRSTVESIARDIELAVTEQVHVKIGEVWAKAVSTANGRPIKGEQSKYEFAIKRVRIGGAELCAENCDPRRVVAQLNQILAGTVEFRIANGIDENLRLGSPKGALTAVQKSLQRQASDRSLIGDFTTEVPGLDMVVYNDNGQWGRSRQLYQFAGVASAATYNISLLPEESEFPPDDPATPEDESLEGVAAGEGGSVGGSTISSSGKSDKDGGIIQTIKRALGALARGVRLFFTNPRQSVLLLTGWALFSLPGVLARRRMRLLQHL